jgi:heme/copper-type cytochrome/quinol oxidase subunit 3
MWFLVGQCAFFALFFGVATWVWAHKRDRTPTQTGKMWVTAWVAAGFVSAGVLLTSGGLIAGSPMPRGARYLVAGLAVGAIVAGFIGGAIHGLIARKIQRLGPDADYGDLDNIPAPEESLRR